MIFEGTKNQFFFGLELTRAGERSPEMAQGFSLSMLYGMSLNGMTFNLQAQEA